MLVVTNLAKSYPTPRGPLSILEDVNLTVERGQSVAIMGPSGCGKSTLLYMLGGLEPPTAGTVTLDGQNPYALSERDQAMLRASRIGFVFQDHLLLPQLSALIVVDEPQDEVVALLARVGLGDRLDHRPAELSGGERQRVAIARALIRQPSLVLCDEPTGNLDSASASDVADLLVAIQAEGQTMMVVVTHSPAFAGRFDRQFEVNQRTIAPMASTTAP